MKKEQVKGYLLEIVIEKLIKVNGMILFPQVVKMKV